MQSTSPGLTNRQPSPAVPDRPETPHTRLKRTEERVIAAMLEHKTGHGRGEGGGTPPPDGPPHPGPAAGGDEYKARRRELIDTAALRLRALAGEAVEMLGRVMRDTSSPSGSVSIPPPWHRSGGVAGRQERALHIANIALFAFLLGLLIVFVLVYLVRPQPTAPVWWERTQIPMPAPSPLLPEEVPPAKKSDPVAGPSKSKSSAVRKCVGVGVAGALAAACQVHIPTKAKAGDCSVEPARSVKGEEIPEDIDVTLVSLNGEKCARVVNEDIAAEPAQSEKGTSS